MTPPRPAAAADELRQVAAELGTPLLRAHAAARRRRGAPGRGRPKAALVELRRAFNEFHALGVRYDAARTRLLIADACEALGDHDAAGDGVERGPLPCSNHSARRRPGTRSRRRSHRHPTVSPAASSRFSSSSPEARRTGIAEELFISEKTVASHVSHIFTKLGVASRSAATAYAYDHDLVRAPGPS